MKLTIPAFVYFHPWHFRCRRFLFFFIGLFFCAQLTAQVHNTGNMYVSGNVYINSDFVNTSTAAYLNNGVLYLTGNFSNDQPAMAEGTGTTRFNGTSLQLINGNRTTCFS